MILDSNYVHVRRRNFIILDLHVQMYVICAFHKVLQCRHPLNQKHPCNKKKRLIQSTGSAQRVMTTSLITYVYSLFLRYVTPQILLYQGFTENYLLGIYLHSKA